MEKILIPFLFLLIAFGLFFSYIQPTYEALQAMDEQEVRLDEAIVLSNELKAKLDSLRQTYADISESDHRRLAVILPEQVDVVRTIIQFDAMIQRSGLIMKEFTIPVDENAQKNNTSGNANASDPTLEHKEFSFECVGQYQGLKTLLPQIERNLALMDITGLSITQNQSTSIRGNRLPDAGSSDMLYFKLTLELPSLQSISSL